MGRVIVRHHEAGYRAIENRIVNMGQAVTRAVTRDAEDMAPVETGELVSTIKMLRVAQYTWWVTVSAEHWMYQEYGTRGRNPVIRPKYKQALWWPGLKTPIAIVTKHPGNEAQPFMRPAVYQTRYIWFTPNGAVAVST